MNTKKIIKYFISVVIALFLGVTGLNLDIQETKTEVELIRVIDGDTAWFKIDGHKEKVRFLYIDTPEDTKIKEAYGNTATDFVKNALENASKIEIEYDGPQKDKYDRTLAWVFYDGKLLQDELTKAGLVEKFYDYGEDYKYKNQLKQSMKEAREKKRGIYQNEKN